MVPLFSYQSTLFPSAWGLSYNKEKNVWGYVCNQMFVDGIPGVYGFTLEVSVEQESFWRSSVYLVLEDDKCKLSNTQVFLTLNEAKGFAEEELVIALSKYTANVGAA